MYNDKYRRNKRRTLQFTFISRSANLDHQQGELLGTVAAAAPASRPTAAPGPVRRGLAVQAVRAPVAGRRLAAQFRADRVRRGPVRAPAVGARGPAAADRAHRGRVRGQAGVGGRHRVAAAARGRASVRRPGARRRRPPVRQHPAHGRRGPARRLAPAAGRRPQAGARPDRQPADFAQPAGRLLQLHHVGELRHQRAQR